MIFLINFLNHEVFEHGHIVDSSIFQKKELIYEHILAVIRSLYGCHPIAISTYRWFWKILSEAHLSGPVEIRNFPVLYWIS